MENSTIARCCGQAMERAHWHSLMPVVPIIGVRLGDPVECDVGVAFQRVAVHVVQSDIDGEVDWVERVSDAADGEDDGG